MERYAVRPPRDVNWNVKAKREPSFWIFSATAVVMLIAIGIFIWSTVESKREGARVTASESPRTGGGMAMAQYEVLARVFPPAYREVGDAQSPRPAEFRTAIERYSNRDYSAAIDGLGAVVEKHPGLVEARLYLGICYLFTNNRPAGIAELRNVVDAGQTPYLEQARFYLAKGLLGTGDIAGTRQQLNEAIAMHGEMAQQAETLLTRIK